MKINLNRFFQGAALLIVTGFACIQPCSAALDFRRTDVYKTVSANPNWYVLVNGQTFQFSKEALSKYPLAEQFISELMSHDFNFIQNMDLSVVENILSWSFFGKIEEQDLKRLYPLLSYLKTPRLAFLRPLEDQVLTSIREIVSTDHFKKPCLDLQAIYSKNPINDVRQILADECNPNAMLIKQIGEILYHENTGTDCNSFFTAHQITQWIGGWTEIKAHGLSYVQSDLPSDQHQVDRINHAMNHFSEKGFTVQAEPAAPGIHLLGGIRIQ